MRLKILRFHPPEERVRIVLSQASPPIFLQATERQEADFEVPMSITTQDPGWKNAFGKMWVIRIRIDHEER